MQEETTKDKSKNAAVRFKNIISRTDCEGFTPFTLIING